MTCFGRINNLHGKLTDFVRAAAVFLDRRSPASGAYVPPLAYRGSVITASKLLAALFNALRLVMAIPENVAAASRSSSAAGGSQSSALTAARPTQA